MKDLLIILSILLLPVIGNKLQPKSNIKAGAMVDTSYSYSIQIIKKWEKFSPVRYTLFNDTYIGYGHLLRKNDTLTSLTEHQADSLLKSDFNKALHFVNNNTNSLPENRKYVLTMFAFNCGVGKLKKSKLLEMVNNNYPDSLIKQQYYKYTWSKGRNLPKLKKRRYDEFLIY